MALNHPTGARPDIAWRKSSRCESHTCVEVGVQDGAAHVRDGKLGAASPQLRISAAGFSAFLQALRQHPEPRPPR